MPGDAADNCPAEGAHPVIAGRYTLVERLGVGGMGEVWVARQTEPVRRQVALKLIKAGMDSEAVLARFERERQALALMDHPNIARVLDGGLTPDGRPFFAMELVNGLPLTRFCDEHRLTPRQRLELFVPVCQAVQHAHQKGVIHRDLKPSNILVTVYDGRPVPKVIDFGFAKATGEPLSDSTLSTQFGAAVGTLQYMAPEQAGEPAVDVDTRADVYALGVVLYELLTGLRPIETQRLRQAALGEVLRVIREVEPPRPSARLSSDGSLPAMAALRQTEPRRLAALLRGELDWVVMKYLEKDRSRRYETADGLARDVERYLADEPVEARPASTGYRLRKFVTRNCGPAMAGTAVLVAVFGGIIGTTWQAVRAEEARADEARQRRVAEVQRDRAEGERTRADREADLAREAEADTKAFGAFLDKRVLSAARPKDVQGGLGVDVTVSDALVAAEKYLAEDFAGKPKAEALARHAIAVTWRNRDRLDEAEIHLRRALELRIAHVGPDAHEAYQSRNSLAVTVDSLGRYVESEALFAENVRRCTTTLGPSHPDTLRSVGCLALACDRLGR